MKGPFYSPALLQVVIRVLQDTPYTQVTPYTDAADAVALVGETSEQQLPVLNAIGELYYLGEVERIAITRFPGEERGDFKVAGFSELKKWFENMGVSDGAIVGYPLSTKKLNGKDLGPCTDAEAIGLVGFAKEQGWKSIYVVAPPLHQVRVFVSVVSAVVKTKSNLKVYSYPAETQPWLEEVLFSQSAPRARRVDQIPGEFEKMRKYYEEYGDHISPEEVLRYLEWRDASSVVSLEDQSGENIEVDLDPR